MIVRTLESVSGTPMDVAAKTWRSIRLATAKDGLGFSFHETRMKAGTRTEMQYANHVEAVYCVEGRGSIRDLESGALFPIEPGTLYLLDRHDRHEVVVEEELRLLCVFDPGVRGDEVHDPSGAYPASSTPVTTPSPYATRGEVPAMRARLEPVLHAGLDASGPWSREELADFGANGFIVARGLLDEAEVRALRGAIDDAAATLANDERVIREPESNTVRSLFAFHQMPMLSEFAKDERLVERAQQILGPELAIHQTRVNFKLGGEGDSFAWHSDFETWHAEDGMPRMQALTAMVALTPNTPENGPLRVIPGSHTIFVATAGQTPENHHLSSLRRQEYGVPDPALLASLEKSHGSRVLLLEPGDVVFFDCNLLHGSGKNETSVARTNAFVVYDALTNRPRLKTPTAPRPAHVSARGDEPAIVAAKRR